MSSKTPAAEPLVVNPAYAGTPNKAVGTKRKVGGAKCTECNEPGHVKKNCPKLKAEAAVAAATASMEADGVEPGDIPALPAVKKGKGDVAPPPVPPPVAGPPPLPDNSKSSNSKGVAPPPPSIPGDDEATGERSSKRRKKYELVNELAQRTIAEGMHIPVSLKSARSRCKCCAWDNRMKAQADRTPVPKLNTYCETCNVALCIRKGSGCWLRWHTKSPVV